jgi:hypothetical protein
VWKWADVEGMTRCFCLALPFGGYAGEIDAVGRYIFFIFDGSRIYFVKLPAVWGSEVVVVSGWYVGGSGWGRVDWHFVEWSVCFVYGRLNVPVSGLTLVA